MPNTGEPEAPPPLGGEADPNHWHFRSLGEDGPLPNPVGHTFPLLTHDVDGRWSVVGTGFCGDGLFLTARHVVEHAFDADRQLSPLVILHLYSRGGFGATDMLLRPIMQCWLGDAADIALGVAATVTNNDTGKLLQHWRWPLSWAAPPIGSPAATYAFPRHALSEDGAKISFHPDLFPGSILGSGDFRDRTMVPHPFLEFDCRVHGAASGGPLVVADRVVGTNSTELDKNIDHPPGPAYGAQIRCLGSAYIEDAALLGEDGTRRLTFDELVRAGCVDVANYVGRDNEALSGRIVRPDLPVNAPHPEVRVAQYF